MPNWVRCNTYINGEDNKIEELKNFVITEECKFDFNKIIPMPEEYNKSEDWYYWCINNWGTKWNASNAKWNKNFVVFDTAWSFPYPVFQKLSHMFPEVEIYAEFADEDIGNNCGSVSLKDGKGDIDWINTEEFALQVWGYEQ